MTNSIADALTSKNKYAQVVSILFNARTNAHFAHLQTKSYAAHKALNEFYDDVVGIADSFAEAAQGDIGIITGYSIGQLNTGDIVSFLKNNLTELRNLRTQFNPSKEGHLIQLIDDMQELYTSTIYKLVNLK